MSRWLVIVVATVLSTACSTDDDHDRPPRTHVEPTCSAQTTCGSCTPVLGCGWCAFADGTGKCASSPSACGDNFRWNWETAGCPAEPDAGVVVDAPATDTAPVVDSGVAETESEVASEAGACTTSAPPSGCSITSGGSLCAAAEYTVGCHATTNKPDGCTAKAASGTSTYYCCPCN